MRDTQFKILMAKATMSGCVILAKILREVSKLSPEQLVELEKLLVQNQSSK